jgi:exodeoxyribonuclease VII small subunit
MAKKSTKIDISYADAIKELEQILENLRSGKVEINDLTATVKRANELVEECRRQLSLTRYEIERITTSAPF